LLIGAGALIDTLFTSSPSPAGLNLILPLSRFYGRMILSSVPVLYPLNL